MSEEAPSHLTALWKNNTVNTVKNNNCYCKTHSFGMVCYSEIGDWDIIFDAAITSPPSFPPKHIWEQKKYLLFFLCPDTLRSWHFFTFHRTLHFSTFSTQFSMSIPQSSLNDLSWRHSQVSHPLCILPSDSSWISVSTGISTRIATGLIGLIYDDPFSPWTMISTLLPSAQLSWVFPYLPMLILVRFNPLPGS